MFKIKIRRGGMTSNRRTYNMVCYKGEKPRRLYLSIAFGFHTKSITIFY